MVLGREQQLFVQPGISRLQRQQVLRREHSVIVGDSETVEKFKEEVIRLRGLHPYLTNIPEFEDKIRLDPAEVHKNENITNIEFQASDN